MKDISIQLKFLYLNSTKRDIEEFQNQDFFEIIESKEVSYFSKMPDLKNMIHDVFLKKELVMPAITANDHNYKITARQKNYGLCVQMGNIANFAFDILKLNEAKDNTFINKAIVFVPTKRTEKYVDSGNCATWERIFDKKNFYERNLKLPTCVCGLDLLT